VIIGRDPDSIKEHALTHSQDSTATMESAEVAKQPLYPLIEYPDGLDFNDVYGKVTIEMVTGHVTTTCTYIQFTAKRSFRKPTPRKRVLQDILSA
jgi:hypothetical protein